MDYESWTKEALIERLRRLEQSENQQQPAEKLAEEHRSKKRRNTEFDFSRFPQRKIALKFSYFGWPYHGLARQGNALGSEDKRHIEEQYPTVEGELFRALAHCKLIESEATCGYSRCGRTDRGVSSFGQVVALYVRSSGKYVDSDDDVALLGTVTQSAQNDGRRVLLPSAERELPYVSMLNKSLPSEIRVLAWSPVAEDFDARFSCKARFYRYFFSEAGLDIAAMRNAAVRYKGTHDFRNFCRLDPAKQISNFERTVLDVDITGVPRSVEFIGDGSHAEGRWWQLELRGTAFLWHQVRCMMAILFLVGQHLETPDIVDRLMDVATLDGKPEYEMASDLPLVLADCTFDEKDVSWIYVRDGSRDYGNMTVLDRSILREWGQISTRAVVAGALLQTLRSTQIPATDDVSEGRATASWADCRERLANSELPGGAFSRLGGGTVKHVRKYVPILNRKRAEPVDVRNRAWLERKGASRNKRRHEEAGDKEEA
ncbi:pseudouridine synthase deg1 [Coemansia asiatica]|uniref:Pseudouridine synthase deg1 n=1 Tax=Coemansia asiatica TaxID=1052880 RepID=A0A9W7XGF2_9FUNG|nr:pseudouridine synthase deg1 [Coemansia asiatica]